MSVIDPIAEALKDLAGNLDVTPPITGEKWEPREFDRLPAGTVGPPHIRRIGVDERESQIGAKDWLMDYPVNLYFSLDHAKTSQAQMVEAVEALIDAVDGDPGLGGLVLDAKVVDAEPFIERDRANPLIGYQATVQVLRLV